MRRAAIARSDSPPAARTATSCSRRLNDRAGPVDSGSAGWGGAPSDGPTAGAGGQPAGRRRCRPGQRGVTGGPGDPLRMPGDRDGSPPASGLLELPGAVEQCRGVGVDLGHGEPAQQLEQGRIEVGRQLGQPARRDRRGVAALHRDRRDSRPRPAVRQRSGRAPRPRAGDRTPSRVGRAPAPGRPAPRSSTPGRTTRWRDGKAAMAASAAARAPASHRATTCQAMASAWNTPRPPALLHDRVGEVHQRPVVVAGHVGPDPLQQRPLELHGSERSVARPARQRRRRVTAGDGIGDRDPGPPLRPQRLPKAVTAITLPTAVGMTASIVSAVARSPGRDRRHLREPAGEEPGSQVDHAGSAARPPRADAGWRAPRRIGRPLLPVGRS